MKHRQVYILHGVAASAGIAIGHAVIIDRRKIERYPKIRITEGLIDDEIKRFDDAVEASYKQIDEAKKKLESRSNIKEHALTRRSPARSRSSSARTISMPSGP